MDLLFQRQVTTCYFFSFQLLPAVKAREISLTLAVWVCDEVLPHAEVLIFGVVHVGGLTVPLRPQDVSFPLKLDVEGADLAILGHFHRNMTRNNVSVCKRIAGIDGVISNFYLLYCRQHRDRGFTHQSRWQIRKPDTKSRRFPPPTVGGKRLLVQ